MSLREAFKIRDGKQPAPAVGKPAVADVPPAPVVVRDKNDSDEIIDALLHGKEIVTQIDTDYGVFEFRYPTGSDKILIARRRADYMGNHPDSSFDNARRMLFEKWATLDILVVGKPERFKDMDSWADCPLSDLTDEVYDRGARFCGDIQKRLRGSGPGKPVEAGESKAP